LSFKRDAFAPDVKVSDEEELKAHITDDTIVSIEANINLTSAVEISNVIGLVILGNGFKIDGQQKGSCFLIESGSSAILSNMTITHGHAVINEFNH